LRREDEIMVYNRNLDETIWTKDVDISNPFNKGTKFKFVVSVMRYKDGQPKIDIKRLTYGAYKKGEYGKVGRISKYELDILLPMIEEAMEYL
jgi:hypothetical protein